MDNRSVARSLRAMAQLLEANDDNPYRAIRYRQAAERIGQLTTEIVDNPRALLDLHLDKTVIHSVQTLLLEGASAAFSRLAITVPVSLSELLQLPGIGPKTAKRYLRAGIASLADLQRVLSSSTVSQHFSLSQAAKLRTDIAALLARQKIVPIGWGRRAAEFLQTVISACPGIVRTAVTGDVARFCPAGDTVAIVAGCTEGALDEAEHAIRALGYEREQSSTPALLIERLAIRLDQSADHSNENRTSLWHQRLSYDGRTAQAYVYLTTETLFAVALVATSGDQLYVDTLLKWCEQPLPDRADESAGSLVKLASEAAVYATIGFPYIPVELREGYSMTRATAPLVQANQLRGDLHMHTDASDGRHSLRAMVAASLTKGYDYVVITDHSRSLQIANGLSIDRLRRQQEEILALREEQPGITILHGSEVDILAKPGLDYPDEVLAALDFVVASIHVAFNQPQAELTARIVYAIEHPQVAVIGHPTGRMLGRRDPYPLDFERIFRTAAGGHIALELNSNPNRLDLDPHWLRLGREAGCLFAISSDAHSIADLDRVHDYGVIMARKGWLEADHVLNCLPLHRLLGWLRTPKKQRAYPHP